MGELDVVFFGQVDKIFDNLMDDEGILVDVISVDRVLQLFVELVVVIMDVLDKEDVEVEDGEDSVDELDS